MEALEKKAIRRMESGLFSEEKIEKLGNTLQSLEEEIERLKSTEEIDRDVEELRKDLDEIVKNAIYKISESENNFKN